VTLYSLPRCAKALALLVGFLLVLASLDNVPDCPELLAQKHTSVASIQLTSNPLPPVLYGAMLAWHLARFRDSARSEYVSEPVAAPLPNAAPPLLAQASDPSPPQC
jgi:hypothetical protein